MITVNNVMMVMIFLSGMKAPKASIKGVFMPIAWYPSLYWDWRMSEDEKKKEIKKLWA